jgi:hypothetical protein
MGRAQPPSGFRLQEQELADPAAERQVNDKRMSQALVQQTRERQFIRSIPGGQKALARLQKLELARKERERELLQPVEVVKREYAEVLKKKLQSDTVYQAHKEAVTSAEEELKDSNEVSELLEKHRKRVAGNGNADVLSRDELLAVINESDDAPQLRKAFQSNHAARQKIWRLKGEAGKRQREIEQTDPELLEIKRREKLLQQNLRNEVLARDEQLLRLTDEIALAKREVQRLNAEAPQQQIGDDN